MTKLIKSADLKIGLAAIVIGLISVLPMLALSPIYNSLIQTTKSCVNDPSAIFCVALPYILALVLDTAISIITGLILGTILGIFLYDLRINHPWLIGLIGTIVALVLTPLLRFSPEDILVRIVVLVGIILAAYRLFGHNKAPITNLNSTQTEQPVETTSTVQAPSIATYNLPNLSQSVFLAGIIGSALISCLIFPFLSFLAFPIGLVLVFQIFKRQHTPQPGPTTALTIALIIISFFYVGQGSLSLLLVGISSQSQPWLYCLLFIASPIVAQFITYISSQANHQTKTNISTKNALAILDDKTNLSLFIFGLLGLAFALVLSWIHFHYGPIN